MDIALFRREGRPLLPAALALVLLGASLVFLTWRNLEGQRELIDNHIRLSARASLRSVQASLARGIRRLRPTDPQAFLGLVSEYFREMTASRDVALLAIYDDSGGPLVYSGPEGATRFDLPPELLEELADGGEWFSSQTIGGRKLLLLLAPARPDLDADFREPPFPFFPFRSTPRLFSRELAPFSSPSLPELPSFAMPSLPGFPSLLPPPLPDILDMPPPPPPLFPGPPSRPKAYILLGLDTADFEAPYRNVRRAAILQAGYVLAVGIFSVGLVAAAARRREQNTRLLRLETFHSRLLDNMPDGLITLDAAGRVTAFNPAAQELLSRLTAEKTTELMGSRWDDIIAASPPGSPPAALSDEAGKAKAPVPRRVASEGSWRLIEREGLCLELRGVPVESSPDKPDDAPERLILVRDRTDIRRLERDLAEAVKLAAIGRLAAGVAHEIRNPLSSLRGFAQFFAAKLQGREPEETYARTMVHEADRLNRVVADLLFLARPRQLCPETVSLAALTAEVAQLLCFDIEHKKAALTTDLRTATVTADPDALKQALINLILNSLAALP
ncbi:MAG: PAS domain-containing protein, partial [Desulfovibrio sp.]|nr:PAS domain-containing protein [Desulfovibrio sp.]